MPPRSCGRRRGDLEVHGELELGAQLAEVPYLAVTGTNGKTTTTGMLAACLRAGGLDAVACGNIGRPFTTAATEAHDALVVECSSFQLERQRSFHPRVSVLVNLAPDHLDRHVTFEAYGAAKARVFAHQTGDDVHVGNRDDAAAAAISSTATCSTAWFRAGAPEPGEVGYAGDRLVARRDDAAVDLGTVDGSRAGFREDAAAAAASALAFGVDAEAIAMGLAGYEPARHRGEVVAVIDGVRFVDNSKATNVHAALAAIDGVDDAVLIAGGRAKGADLSPLATRATRLRAVVAIGEASDTVVEVFRDRVPVRRAASIEEAVRVAPWAGRAGRHGPARPGVRELGHVRQLRGARRPVHGRRAEPHGGSRHPWVSARRRGAGRRSRRRPRPAPAHRAGRRAPAAAPRPTCASSPTAPTVASVRRR